MAGRTQTEVRQNAAILDEPTPCDDCRMRIVCQVGKLACYSLNCYVIHGYPTSWLRDAPNRVTYERIYSGKDLIVPARAELDENDVPWWPTRIGLGHVGSKREMKSSEWYELWEGYV